MNNLQAAIVKERIANEHRLRTQWEQQYGSHLRVERSQSTHKLAATTQPRLSVSSSTRNIPAPAYHSPAAHSYVSATPRPRTAGSIFAASSARPSSARPYTASSSSPFLRQSSVQSGPRQVVVPVERDVKVPVTTLRVVPRVTTKAVPVRRVVPVQLQREMEEEYTEILEQPTTRQREVWVRQVIPETVMVQVPVVRRRRVRVPVTELQEVEDQEVVQVTDHVVVQEPAYRVDKIQDVRVLESNGPYVRELGSLSGTSRHHVGTNIYAADDARIRHLTTPSGNRR